MADLKIVSILRSGGEYRAAHVLALAAMCQRFLPAHRFLCLTDAEIAGVTCQPLEHSWPGWWAKMEIFRLPPPVLYLDLDTVLVDDCQDILEACAGKPFVILRDVYRGKANPKAMQSSLMYWEAPMNFLYESFRDRPDFLAGGDQSYIEQHLLLHGAPVAYWQDLASGVVSFKADKRQAGARPGDRIIIFHGRPRPWEQTAIDYAIND